MTEKTTNTVKARDAEKIQIDGVRYRKAISELEQGRIPANFDEVVKYAEESIFELRQMVDTLAACVKKQDRTLQLVRAMCNGLKRNAMKSGVPQWVGPSAELIPGDPEEG